MPSIDDTLLDSHNGMKAGHSQANTLVPSAEQKYRGPIKIPTAHWKASLAYAKKSRGGAQKFWNQFTSSTSL